MAKKYMGFTQDEAIEYILSLGWQPWYPVRNIRLTENSFWDGVDRTHGYNWGAAIAEIKARQKPVQLSLFTQPNNACAGRRKVAPIL
jgi:hypothetical protein